MIALLLQALIVVAVAALFLYAAQALTSDAALQRMLRVLIVVVAGLILILLFAQAFGVAQPLPPLRR